MSGSVTKTAIVIGGQVDASLDAAVAKATGSIKSLAVKLLGAFSVASITKWGVGLANTTARVEASMQATLGSAMQAKFVLADLKKVSDAPLQGLAKNFEQLSSVGFASGDITSMLDVFDKVAAVKFDDKASGIDTMVSAFARMKVSGEASAKQFNEFTDSGVDAWKYLAAELGSTVPQAMAAVEKGVVKADTAIRAILTGMGDQFGPLADKLDKTLGSAWDRMAQRAKTVGEWMGQKLESSGAGDALDFAGNALTNKEGWGRFWNDFKLGAATLLDKPFGGSLKLAETEWERQNEARGIAAVNAVEEARARKLLAAPDEAIASGKTEMARLMPPAIVNFGDALKRLGTGLSPLVDEAIKVGRGFANLTEELDTAATKVGEELARKSLAPLDAFEQEVKQLHGLLQMGKIDQATFDRQVADKFAGISGGVGSGPQYSPNEAIQFGSRDAQELAARQLYGQLGTGQTVADLIKEMRRVEGDRKKWQDEVLEELRKSAIIPVEL